MIFFKTPQKNIPRTRGTSLIEMVVYVAIIAIALIVIVGALLSISRSLTAIKNARSVALSAFNAFDRMTRDIRGAESVVTGAGGSVFNTNPGQLSILSSDGSGGTIRTDFLVNASSSLVVQRNGVLLGVLTKDDAQVTSLIFKEMSTGTSTAIQILMQLQSGSGANQQTQNFYDTVVLRGSY